MTNWPGASMNICKINTFLGQMIEQYSKTSHKQYLKLT